MFPLNIRISNAIFIAHVVTRVRPTSRVTTLVKSLSIDVLYVFVELTGLDGTNMIRHLFGSFRFAKNFAHCRERYAEQVKR